jgi:hypothetical protein
MRLSMRRRQIALWLIAGCIAGFVGTAQVEGQTSTSERVFPQSKADIEKALKAIQSSLSGRLPVLDGFAKVGEHSLDQYQRGFYQATVQILPAAPGKSVVRVTAKVTAWYSDSAGSRSGYALLTSNGRIESDLLDQLADQLAGQLAERATVQPAEQTSAQPAPQPASPPPVQAAGQTAGKNAPGSDSTRTGANRSSDNTAAAAAPEKPTAQQTTSEPAISAPSATPGTNVFASSLNQGLAAQERASAQDLSRPTNEKADSGLQAEAANLEEILKNQAHPKNLVAVKKSGTPVVASPSLSAKALFLASMHDEFEILDFNPDWVHVRISGLSRGWIWRNSVEMPEGIPDSVAQSGAGPAPTAADLFHVVREETAQFPGDWEPLRGKNVKIFSVQSVDEKAKDPGSQQRLEYAKFLLEKSYTEMIQKPQNLAGIVLIFDSVDGGMIAATVPALQEWRAGTLSDSALWHRCFFDPPETFDAGAPSGGR